LVDKKARKGKEGGKAEKKAHKNGEGAETPIRGKG